MKNKEHLIEKKEWRDLFDQKQLGTAQNYIDRGEYRDFEFGEKKASASVGSNWLSMFHPRITSAPARFADNWDEKRFSCNCSRANPPSYTFAKKKTCSHEAALLLLWERARGPWTFEETDEEYEERVREERIRRTRAERARRRAEEEKDKREASEWPLAGIEGDEAPYFDIPSAIRKERTNLWALNRGQEILNEGTLSLPKDPEVQFDARGRQVLVAESVNEDEADPARTVISFDGTHVAEHACDCRPYVHNYWRGAGAYGSEKELCPHELALSAKVWEHARRANPGDCTDKAADDLFKYLDGEAIQAEEGPEAGPKDPVVRVEPRLLIDGSDLKLTFRVAKGGAKGLILKGLRQFQEAAEAGGTFSLGKSLSVDFSKETFAESSGRWLRYISGRISEADRVNDRLSHAGRRGRCPGGQAVSVKNAEDLSGAALDQFYDLAEGLDVEFEDRPGKRKGRIFIGEGGARVKATVTSIMDSSGRTAGARVEGDFPRMARGQSAAYAITGESISRISDAMGRAIRPFSAIAAGGDRFMFSVGKSRLAEFYYRVLPQLMESPYIDVTDETKGALGPMLPPEAAFLFRMDVTGDGACRLEAEVSYGEKTYPLLPSGALSGEYRDEIQEGRVRKRAEEYFPFTEGGAWLSGSGDDAVFDVLSRAVPALSKFGEVLGTPAFGAKALRPAPRLSVSAGVGGGLLNIQVLSKDVSAEELREIYGSYKRRKRYHRLADGSYVQFSGDDAFAPVEELGEGVGLPAEALLSGEKQLPLFRALYLDRLLEEHDEIAGRRSHAYRSLVKGFHTVRDADYDVPEHLEDVLRGYQVYGHKWMRTVAAAGFGGILADEMGLGKTLEAISVISALKKEGGFGSALIVCPASLVFNWEEEIRRFSPELSAVPVAGSPRARKDLLSSLPGGDEPPADVYITSYDLLRKDVDIYRESSFSLMVIDEAQYIKNQKAAMTKAVKIIRADRRMALTGTPIENRLAEMWSIFDFLMPGFLHDYRTFSEMFEIPITKRHDAKATERLKQMVGPFILRRRKEDVLKDLPPKLDEVRYARFEDRQRKIYDAQVLKMKGLLGDNATNGKDKIKILAELMRIRQICCDPSLLFEDYDGGSAKREACLELIENAIEGGHRMLVFSQFASMLELLEADLEAKGIEYFKLTGATPKERRIADMHAFNAGDAPVYLISLKAGGTGLNLVGADMAIHYDPWWNMAAQNQATDRAHRIGQERTVTVYRLIVKDTIEERILELQKAKKDLADAILAGEQKSLMSLSSEELMELL